MPLILPSTELRNNFAEIERKAKETKEPIYLTKNGRGSLVVMDIDAFDEYMGMRAYKAYIDEALTAADRDKSSGSSKYTDMEVAFVDLLEEPIEDAAPKKMKRSSKSKKAVNESV